LLTKARVNAPTIRSLIVLCDSPVTLSKFQKAALLPQAAWAKDLSPVLKIGNLDDGAQ
jgi:hypothetical protein